MNSIVEIDSAIAMAGFPECEVLQTARIEARYLYAIRTGRRKLTRKTSSRIQLAIAELKRVRKEMERDKTTDGRTPSASRVAAQYRMSIAFVAQAAGVSPQFILSADPARRATADPQWLKAANLRRVALYIANQYLNLPQADLARAAGMSKSNVSCAMGEIEDDRGNPEIEAILSAVEGAFEG
ncbi:hypothetical protein [Rhizobium sp. PL01]|uniref:hypothetical protein n=1 Tax=Rhizobium sp. PL01 TaxID=3085631 RepID=UPI0029825FED|nr:hypothetical protein [Rhizobium sp. PL01]MDW5313746.1 hypothetical protein [Rhizobium sp. PL01]